ncbi:aquaporin-8a.1 [Dicentrarchus labrax]|uniref:Aquaporin 8a, tandem duplicate 1 n=1 Tax=Dicentrarchus labrax TaxID=13489 RepID=A0A8C4F115_DICLA|nr:aquaporin-8a.1 [Dicentrarchus labrax]
MSGAETKTEIFTVTDMGELMGEKDMSSTNMKRSIFEQYVQPCLAELFGTCLFVFVGCASVIGNVGTAGVLQPAVAHGLALGVAIMMFGQISGGHFNPAVSLSAYLCGGMDLLLLVPYILAQMLGGLGGAGLTRAVYPFNVYNASFGGAFHVVSDDLATVTLAEVIMTTFLTIVVCMGAINSQTRSPLAPFCIGLTVTANILAGGMLSGACMNPARAFGPAVVANHWNHHWIYWVGPTCGALTSVSLIRFVFGDKKTRIVFK